MAVALATGIENVPTRHLLEDTLFSCSLFILYPDSHGNATFSGSPYRSEDARILPVPTGSVFRSSSQGGASPLSFYTTKSVDAC